MNLLFKLKISKPVNEEKDFFINRVVLGKSAECDCVFSFSGISKKHACIFGDNNEFFIKDLSSTTGTRVNSSDIGQKIVRLKNLDLIEIGEVSMVFVVSDVPEALPVKDHNLALHLSRIRDRKPLEIIPEILSEIRNEFNGCQAVILVKSLYSDELLPKYSHNGEVLEHHYPTLKISKTLAYHCFREKKPLVITNAQLNREFAEARSIIAHNITSVLLLPLLISGQTAGVLYLCSDQNRFRQTDGRDLALRADLISLILFSGLSHSQPVSEEDLTGIDPERARLIRELALRVETDDLEMISWLIPRNHETPVTEGQTVAEFKYEDPGKLKKYFHPSVEIDCKNHKIRCRSKGLLKLTDNGLIFKKQLVFSGDTSSKGTLGFDGCIRIDNEISGRCDIVALYDLTINGRINTGNVTSILGDIVSSNYIMGNHANRIKAIGSITAQSAYNTYLKASGDIRAGKNLLGTVVIAGKNIFLDCRDKFRDNVLSAGQSIIVEKIPAVDKYGFNEFKINSSESLSELIREKNQCLVEYSEVSRFIETNRDEFDRLFANSSVFRSLNTSSRTMINLEIQKYVRFLRQEIMLREKIHLLAELIRTFKSFVPHIKVLDTIPAGSTIYINGACLELDAPVSKAVLVNENGKIVKNRL